MEKNSSPAAVLVLWQSLVVANYRSMFYWLARHCRVELVSPNEFTELGGQMVQCQTFAAEDTFGVRPGFLSTRILRVWALHTQAVIFWGLTAALNSFFRRPENRASRKILLCIAEPYSVTALLSYWASRLWRSGRGSEFVCCSLQNIKRNHSPLTSWIQNYLFARSAAILSTGQEQTRLLREEGYEGSVIDFPLWFDSRRFVPDEKIGDDFRVKCRIPTEKGRAMVIGYAGSISEAKGVPDIIKCLESLSHEQSKDAYLVLAGGGPDLESVSRAVEGLEPERRDRVRLVGPVPHGEMAAFFNSLDVLLVPSRTTKNWKEQFGRVVVEAEACGTPAIGSSSGALPEVIGDMKRIFAEGDIESFRTVLVETMNRIRTDRTGFRERMASRAKQRFSDSVVADSLHSSLNTTA